MISPVAENLYILTGTPGTGKTTLIGKFKQAGIPCVDEPARPILEQQLEIDGPDLPAKSPLRFVQAMLRQMEEDFEIASKTPETVIFDRGIPDLVAYAIRFFVAPEQFHQAGRKKRYNPTVFILPPWEEIFVNDELRRLSFAESLLFHDELVKAYLSLEYQLVEVPRVSAEKRIEFVLGMISEQA